ncbi:DNA cytosine methyltransferase [Halalkalibacterium halodurans]|uniref:DNA cytosine methyltransferase n=1 Tax=Halalkalibacterium halodurans TaxID=86665 RepID=UPI002AA9AA71|nr:DNA cytosine methyltransferase [Halalkalibacterium halodurans]MDY7224514.1 DNA cytosine methyltransferase [Halalkalibacterium halodurans]MDY7243799.1 DNA cytosine methyltransferase [Halalkalibacterium halodurans]
MNKAISFFAGAGGLDMGIHRAGFDIKLSVELEKIYCETLRINHPNWNVKCGDIMLYNKDKVYKHANINKEEEIDLVFGGSPCQSFSTAGKRQAFSDPRGKAMLKFVELVTEIQPKAFLLENVRGLLSAALKHRPLNQRGKNYPPLSVEEQPGSAINYLLSKVLNYDVKIQLINAADYGVPQKRERVFIVGVRKDLGIDYNFPKTTHGNNELGKEPWVPVSHILNDLKGIDHKHANYSPSRLKYMKLIPKGGGNWRDLPEGVVKEAMGGAYNSGGGKVGFYRRIKYFEPCPTLLTYPAQKSTNLGHPFEDRPLSIQEYLAIQGFPLNYKVCGTMNHQYTQIGNAVPIQLARILGSSIIKQLRQNTLTCSY